MRSGVFVSVMTDSLVMIRLRIALSQRQQHSELCIRAAHCVGLSNANMLDEGHFYEGLEIT